MRKDQFYRPQVDTNRLPRTLVEKWPGDTLSEGYVPFPKRLLRCLPSVFKGEHAMEDLAAVLAWVDYVRPNAPRLPSLEFLAHLAGMSPGRYEDALDRLQEQELITWSSAIDNLDAVLINLSPLRQAIDSEIRKSDRAKPPPRG